MSEREYNINDLEVIAYSALPKGMGPTRVDPIFRSISSDAIVLQTRQSKDGTIIFTC